MWAEQEEKWKRRGEEEDAELNVHRPKNTRQQTELWEIAPMRFNGTIFSLFIIQ